ncbi:hypothetical protein SCLCIDRAFT_1206801 [Scleroderma citrinum Foug A]|uniref:Uncharacterized protein n=1 Tax=Scleroderma citrinum Foug A TaxID=1036808 RepID=A0A0C3AA98_9AGAM|nr:hypothetical protein SCLCIDRAFT_1206801 [Scleroderma citrinum Foug A]
MLIELSGSSSSGKSPETDRLESSGVHLIVGSQVASDQDSTPMRSHLVEPPTKHAFGRRY